MGEVLCLMLKVHLRYIILIIILRTLLANSVTQILHTYLMELQAERIPHKMSIQCRKTLTR